MPIRADLRIYHLSVMLAGNWEFVCAIEAKTHPEAFRKAMLSLKSEHYDKPIRLEEAMPDARE